MIILTGFNEQVYMFSEGVKPLCIITLTKLLHYGSSAPRPSVGQAGDYIPYPPSSSLLTFLLEYLEHKDLIKYLHMH